MLFNMQPVAELEDLSAILKRLASMHHCHQVKDW